MLIVVEGAAQPNVIATLHFPPADEPNFWPTSTPSLMGREKVQLLARLFELEASLAHAAGTGDARDPRPAFGRLAGRAVLVDGRLSNTEARWTGTPNSMCANDFRKYYNWGVASGRYALRPRCHVLLQRVIPV